MGIDTFRIARKSDAEAIAQLVNGAYRPAPDACGWTHEAHLVAGKRTHAGYITQLLTRPDSVILVGLKKSELVACAHIEKEHSLSHIGMLAVNPVRQGTGLGKQMLSQAEKYAHACFSSDKFILQVISARSELIEFYLRRGYQKTGEIRPFPHSADAGTPIPPDLNVEILEKHTLALVDGTPPPRCG